MEHANSALYLYNSEVLNTQGFVLNETYKVFKGMDNQRYITANNNPDNVVRAVVYTSLGFKTSLTASFVYSRTDSEAISQTKGCAHTDVLYEGFRETYYFCSKCDDKSPVKRG